MNIASQGEAALANSDFVRALQLYTQALIEIPRAPNYYIKRSTAYNRLKPADGGPNLDAALHDAEIALFLARERGKRDLILAAQMRRAVALYQLGRYGDAGFLFGLLEGKILGNRENKSKEEQVRDAMGQGSGSGAMKGLAQELQIWLMKIKAKLGGLEEGGEKRRVGIEEAPVGVKAPTEKELKEQLKALKEGKLSGCVAAAGSEVKKPEASVEAPKEEKPAAPAPAPVQTPEKVRHEWYQSSDSVFVTLYAKGVAKDRVDSEIKSDSVSIQFPLPSGSDFAFDLDPLFAPIDESTSKITVFGTKVELVLRKKTPGQKWSTLESSSKDARLSTATTTTTTPAPPAPAEGPSYPTSSRHGVKDWDKVASTLTAKKPKKSESHSHSHDDDKNKDESKEKTEGDGNDSDNDSDFGGDPVDGFFKKLYAGADDDTRRAMMKSFVESNGTSLSTNWGEVGKGKVNTYESKDD